MTVESMRREIATKYPGEGWKKKVKNMHESQVIAVYHKFLKEDKKPVKAPKGLSPTYTQISIDDYIIGVDIASGPVSK